MRESRVRGTNNQDPCPDVSLSQDLQISRILIKIENFNVIDYAFSMSNVIY